MGSSTMLRASLYIASSVVAVLLIGCNQGGQNSSSAGAHENTIPSSEFVLTEKVYFDEATLEEVAEYQAECHGKGKSQNEKICIQLCHVPPGNHDNSHDKVLPLEATKAHIGHGDYLGSCDGSGGGGEDPGEEEPVDEEPVDEEPVDQDPGSEDPSGEDPGSEDPTGEDPGGGTDIPVWCEPYVSIDANCDGYEDSTNEPYAPHLWE